MAAPRPEIADLKSPMTSATRVFTERDRLTTPAVALMQIYDNHDSKCLSLSTSHIYYTVVNRKQTLDERK